MADSTTRRLSPVEYLERYSMFALALFTMAMGVAFGARSDLGISPISCPPYVLSLGFKPTIGQFTIAMHVIFVLAQILLLRRNFNPVQLLQLVIGVVFGMFVDLAMWLTDELVVENYVLRLLTLFVSCLFIAFGVFLQVSAKALLVAGEGVMLAISKVFGKEFGKVKMCFDCSLVLIGIVISFVLFGELRGIREGTIIAAVLVGFIVSRIQRVFAFIPNWIVRRDKRQEVYLNETEGNNNLVICIARQYGSGGHEIGERLASNLGIKFYDKELINMVAEESGFATEYVENHEQNIKNRIWQDIVVQNYLEPIDQSLSPDDKLFVAEERVVRKLAHQSPCVIVGRCADEALRDMPNVIRVFVYADDDFRARRLAASENVSLAKADEMSKQVNRARANHYNYYTGKEWGGKENYDLMVCASKFGIDKSVALIKSLAK